MEKTTEALKELYRTAVEELGINGPASALTKEIGGLILRFVRGNAPAILQNIQREARPQKVTVGATPRSKRRPFIHPQQQVKRISFQGEVVLGETKPEELANPLEKTMENPVLTPPPGQLPLNPPPPPLEENHVVVVEETEPTPLTIAEFKDLSVNSLAKYGKPVLEATLRKLNLTFAPEMSERQFAKILLESLKPVVPKQPKK